MSYCIDTSSLIAAWEERYPPDHFPKFWQLLEAAIASNHIIIPEAVVDETSKRSAELNKWLKNFSSIAIDDTIQQHVRDILQRFPRLVAERKIAFAADPFVIATAIVYKSTVITEEGSGSPAKPKIPDVCRALDVEPINLIGMIRAEAWVIG